MDTALYPLKFSPIYKEKIWGGKSLKKLFNKDIPSYPLGESWEISTCNEDISVILNGHLKGKNLKEIIQTYQEKILGTKINKKNNPLFPLLIKLLDVTDKLSVQVHPNDIYAKNQEKLPNGKTECWVIIEASKDAQIIYGFNKKTTKQNLLQNIKNNEIELALKKINVKEGDVIFIPAGTVHAILPKLVILEVQQSADITYRLFDWNRTDNAGQPRQLHIEKALNVIDFDSPLTAPITPKITRKNNNYILLKLLKSKYFSLQKIIIKKTYQGRTNKHRFVILFALKGNGTITYNKTSTESITKGEFVLIPAALFNYSITNNDKETLDIIKIYI